MIRINSIAINKSRVEGAVICERCKDFIPLGEQYLMGRYFDESFSEALIGRKTKYCIKCGIKLIDNIDIWRMNKQLNSNICQ